MIWTMQQRIAEVDAVDADETLCATLLGTARNANTAARPERPS
jgi:hypothetical protein